MTGSSQSPEALKKEEERKANAFVRRANTENEANASAGGA
jgi:hypothetical protein